MFLIKTTRHKASLFTLLSVSLLLACFAFLTTSITPAHAVTTTPTTMNFQGRLADSSGNIMPDGLYNMQFRLFTVGSGGSAVWNETRENNGTDYRVQVTNGLFSTKLGQASPLSASLFASGSLYFEITMATPATATCSTASCASWESPMSPRHQLSTSAYAYNAETLDGLDSAAFAQISSNNTFTGTNTISTTNATAFQVQNASTVSALTADTSNLRVQVGSSTTDATAVFFLLDQYNQATDPTNTINGAMYYNTDSNKFRCYQNGAWTDCIGAGAGGATTALDNLASTNINAALNATANDLTLQTTTSGDVNIAPAGVINLQSDAVLASGNTLRIVGDTYTNIEGYSSPTEGQMTYDQTNDQLLVYNATLGKWQADKSDAILVAASNSSQADKNAADYVADGTDDQVQINDALDDADPAGTGRKTGKVYLFAGTYTTHRTASSDATIFIPNNTTLAGAGRGTLIQLGDIDVDDNLIENSDTTTGTGVVIQDLKLDGQRTLNTAGVQNGIYFNGMGDKTTSRDGGIISNVVLSNFRTNGVHLNNSDNNTISENDSSSMLGYEGYFVSSSDNKIINNTFRGGIYLDTVSYSIIKSNDIPSGSYGIYLLDSTDNQLSSNFMQSNLVNGIRLSGVSNRNILSSNTIIDSGNSTENNGIEIDSSSWYNHIIGNYITDSSCGTGTLNCRAIDLQGSYNYLSDNYFSDTDADATANINDASNSNTYSNQATAVNGMSITNRSANSTTAFQVQNAADANILVVDNINSEVEIGSASLAGKLAISDGSSNTATITVGALAGNYTVTIPTITGNDTFCLESLGNCSGGSGATTALDNLASTNINAALNATSNNLTLQTTTSGDVNIAPAGVINLQGDAVLASGNTLRIVGDTYTNIEGYSSPTEGQITYDQTNDQLLVYNATLGKWQADKSDAILVAASNSSQADKNAADYVADGTDDQVQINAALTAADPASGTRKTGKVYLFPGTYTTNRTASGDATIKLPNNTTLAGAGPGTLLRLGSNVVVADNIIENVDTTNGTGVVVRDMQLDGQRTFNVNTTSGIYFNGMGGGTASGRGGTVTGVWVHDTSYFGINLSNSVDTNISNNRVYDIGAGTTWQYGIYLHTNSNDNKITNNTVQGTNRGIYLDSSTGNDISGNNVQDSRNNGIYLTSTSDNNIIINNTLKDDVSYPIYLASSSNNSITSNTILGSSATYSIYSSNSSSNSIGNNILQQGGLYLSGGSKNIFNDNIVDGQVYIRNASSSNSINNNTINASGAFGVDVTEASVDNSISNNYIIGAGVGVRLVSNQNNVTSNFIIDSGGATTNNGILITGTDSSRIIGNTITDTQCDTTCYAINISDATSDNNYLSGNVFSDTDVDDDATINDAGTGTVYSNQPLAANGGDITTRTVASDITLQTTTSGDINLTPAGVINLTGTTTITGTTNLNTTGTANTNIGNGSTGTVTLGDSGTGAVSIESGTSVGITGATTITGTANLNTTGTANTNIGNGSTGTVTVGDSSTGTINVQSGSDITLTTNSNSTGVLVQSATNSATAFEIQNASSNVLFGVDTSASKVLFGTAGSVGGVLQINAATSGNVTISIPATTTSYSLVLPSTAGSADQCLMNSSTPGTLTWGSCGGGGGETKTVSLIPEFAGGTLQADGSNNAGIMNADFVSGLSAGEGYKHSYYQWTTSNTSAQDYNIIVNTQIPSDYASALGNLKIWGYSTSTTLATATIQFADQDGTTCYASPVSFTPSTASTWEQKTVGTMSGCTFSANDIVTVTIVVAAEDDQVFRVGELSFEYTN